MLLKLNKITKRIKNSGRYITSETLKQCFVKGKHLKVDKGRTGNGFTTAMMNATVPRGKFNILIMMNRGVIEDKERRYRENKGNNKKKIAFIYGGSKDTLWTKADLYVIIVDSFVIKIDYFLENIHLINWVLIDESHTVKTDSSFRKVLKGFDNKLRLFLIGKRNAVTSVTASPMLYTENDIFIENENMPEIVINVSSDRNLSIKNAKGHLMNDEFVLIATNNKNVIYKLRDSENRLVANFYIGKKLTQKLLPMLEIVHDPNSKLTIISKTAFEGIDLKGKDYSIYFFEDRGREFETFYAANLYQAISRVRDEASYWEYNRRGSVRDVIDVVNLEKEVDKLIANKKISTENKQGAKYKKYSNYLIFDYHKKNLVVTKDKVGFELLRETIEYNKGFDAFTPFFDSRNVKFKTLDEAQLPFSSPKIRKEIKRKNLTANYKIIRNEGYYNDDNFNLRVNSRGIGNKDLKEIESYLLLKRYDWNRGDVENEDRSRPLQFREQVLLDLFSNPKELDKLVKKVTKSFNKSKIEKFGRKGSAQRRNMFSEQATRIVYSICKAFGNGKITVPKKIVGSRDYNIFTELNLSGINIIAEKFDIDVLEVDIKSAYPRIIYALRYLELPEGFYGKGKKNKIAIHKGMNNFRFNKELNTTESQQRSDSVKKLKKLGFEANVVEGLIKRFFISPFKGDMFNYIAYFEKEIISKVIDLLKDKENDGVVRRHDSVIIFNNRSKLTELHNFTFETVGGWFDIPEALR